MRSVVVRSGPRCEVKHSPIPVPGPRDVLIRILFCASNPRDWTVAEQWPDHEVSYGVEMSGIVEEVGLEVYEFHEGDRVAAMYPGYTPGGAYAEFATAPVHLCFLVPPNVSLEEATTIPFSLCSAALGMYRRLRLPFPIPATDGPINPPLIIYGASMPVGAFALKLASLSKFHKIIAVCKGGSHYVENLEMASHIITYEEGNIVQKITRALNGDKCWHAIDAVNNGTSWEHLTQVLEPHDSRASISNMRPDLYTPFGATVEISLLAAVDGNWIPLTVRPNQDDEDFLYLLFRVLGQWLAEGKMSGHPFNMLANGLNGVEDGLRLLKGGRISCQKLTYRILDTYWGADPPEPLENKVPVVYRYHYSDYSEWDY